MSKFKKNKFSLEDLLEERLEEYEAYIEDEYDTYASNRKEDSSIVQHDKGFYDSLMKLYVKDLESLTKNLKPSTYQVISGSGPAWFFEPTTKKMIKTDRGIEIVVVPGEADEYGRLLVRTMNTFIMVPREEVLDLGYN
tara:strand:- start:2012 stop:2425 length:414 start_codon:yes stop_codon:yes gene_type:complete